MADRLGVDTNLLCEVDRTRLKGPKTGSAHVIRLEIGGIGKLIEEWDAVA